MKVWINEYSDSEGHAFESHRAYHWKPSFLRERAVFMLSSQIVFSDRDNLFFWRNTVYGVIVCQNVRLKWKICGWIRSSVCAQNSMRSALPIFRLRQERTWACVYWITVLRSISCNSCWQQSVYPNGMRRRNCLPKACRKMVLFWQAEE